ncbi:heme lyase CcmF/NrfE family subunit [Bacillus marinisedimentorum]|uniref:heme lyase CcmF/NrfE family subunit n=1 Tax=Bacillus marinisedimentorum TaxID=1821260 RepID=UPI0008722F5A|nr:heme lyase CcmF/NrfE family subunit [Bacillus marinisedimentorum]
MYLLGNITLVLGVVLSLYCIAANIIGLRTKSRKWIESARGGVLSLAFVGSIASFGLLYLLGTSQFQYKYVASYTNVDLPLVYKLTAFWAGNEGSLLLWTLLLSLYGAIVVYSRNKNNQMIPYVSIILCMNMLFFYLVMLVNANPFAMTDTIPPDGKGLNPMLQNPGMIIHPVALYLGYVGLAVPFAFGLAALMMKRMDAEWIKLTRKWTLTAWLFLTIGNIVGGWWAYLELGWGGYWAWDPVENASFLPWLTVSAFLHSVMIQERKNMLKIWNISLIVISYLLTLFGTFLVRSGILTSVHAFTNKNLGAYFLIFMAFMMLFSLYIVGSRYQLIKSESTPIESYFSKESSFLLNNMIFLAAAFAVLWGTMYPLISEAVTGTKVNVGAPYFNKVMAPIMLGLILLMAVSPLLPWHKAAVKKFAKTTAVPLILAAAAGIGLAIFMKLNGIYAIIGFTAVAYMVFAHILEFWTGTKARRKATGENYAAAFYKLFKKNQRRYGGYVVHIGIALIAIGVIASSTYEQEEIHTVGKGERIAIGDYELTFEGLAERRENNNGIVYANMAVTFKGKEMGSVKPEKIFYETWPEPSTEVALKSNWREDLYVVLSSWENQENATLQVKVNPFVSWIWLGGAVMTMGTLIALFGGKTAARFKINRLTQFQSR